MFIMVFINFVSMGFIGLGTVSPKGVLGPDAVLSDSELEVNNYCHG